MFFGAFWALGEAARLRTRLSKAATLEVGALRDLSRGHPEDVGRRIANGGRRERRWEKR